VIPAPASVTAIGGPGFTLTATTAIEVPAGSDDAVRVGEQLASLLRPATGFPLSVTKRRADPPVAPTGAPTIALVLEPGQAHGAEGYALEADARGVSIRANTAAGLFYGAQTLRQLLPAAIEARTPQPGPWTVPAVRIADGPRFPWRGAMLDVSRHFFSVADIERYIDLIAAYKINRLHLHLSDDQGWRIEIASWPRLTAHGGSTAVGGGAGGFYTQADYRRIVAYAAARHVVIVPEIDVPGHTNAALASYAELNCDGQAPPLYTGIEVGFSTLCVDKDVTYRFLDDVIRELAGMTPGPWIHVGGDEVEKLTDEQYARFMERVQDIVVRHGKRPVGWEEMAKARLVPGTLVQEWRSEGRAAPPPWTSATAARAISQGARLILSPAARVYLDMKYDATTKLGLDWAGLVEVRDAYDWDPAALFVGVEERHVEGVEAPLWTETIETMDHIEAMVFPRLPGVAEIGWSPAGRSWEEYRGRLARQAPRWEALGVDYYRSPQVPWP
jgi:hexosaminidase